ncbi:DNA helicase RecQ [Chitinophaga costaii]|nr:DNA helicase RecQ [Chitinophaga costaii]
MQENGTIVQARAILKQYFGYEQFRPLQEEIIEKILQQQDVLVLMPTGGGKSICYQVPALVFPGLTIVISPLIALMKDQVTALKANGIGAAYLNSTIGMDEEQWIKHECVQGRIKLLYISPERLQTELRAFLPGLPVSLIAIDEAHCISQWGHDFRPEYTQLASLKTYFPKTPLVALTATADKTTRKDILQQLALPQANVFLASFDRPNLSLQVRSNIQKREKMEEIKDFIQSRPQDNGIIYCMSRKTTEEVAAELGAALRPQGISVAYYHAGMPADYRDAVQQDFINDRVQVMCATIAFGMGIDKSNVRWVMHYNLPRNMEGYYQEIGRAGRDGLPSDTILYFNMGDLNMLTRFAQESGQQEMNMEKLNRMRQYAEANTCRRKVLLSYFGETLEQQCNNCDVCANPRSFFDGTLLTQKALSALLRLHERVGSQMLIDVLRGSQRAEILQHGYDKIKTYGAGADVSNRDWQQYLLQLLDQGIVEIAYDENFTMKVTDFGKTILAEKRSVQLTRPVDFVPSKPTKEKNTREKKAKQDIPADEQLFEALRKLRYGIAKEENIPAYVIFNDNTLKEMAAHMPVNMNALKRIPGVGDAKAARYGERFTHAIQDFMYTYQKKDTYSQTWELYEQGLSVEDIATQRGLTQNTIILHLQHWAEKGKEVRFQDLVAPDLLLKMRPVYAQLQVTDKLKPYYEHFNGTVSYDEIRLALLALQER